MNTVLFVCIHNSARSQMAAAWLNRLCRGECSAESAGIEPGTLNPLVVEVMGEVGVDIAHNATRSVEVAVRSGKKFSHVITVCDEASAERCPVVPGSGARLHWGFPDPSALDGTREELLSGTREIRDSIRAKVEEWCREVCLQGGPKRSGGKP